MAYDNCFLIDTQFVHDSAIFRPSSHSFSDLSARPPLSLVNSLIKTVLDNGIKVYGDIVAVKQISELVFQYLSIWESQGFVQIPPDR